MKKSILILGTAFFLSSGYTAIKPHEEGINAPKPYEYSPLQAARLRLEFQPDLTVTELEMLLDTIKNQKEQPPK
jgi:hypothetical protein